MIISAYTYGVHIQDSCNETPLHHFSRMRRDRADICRILLEAGSNVNGKDSYGFFPLLHAIYFEKENTAKLLIDFGSEMDDTFKSFDVCVKWGVIMRNRQNCREACVSFLLAKRRLSGLIGPGNGRDVLRIVSQHLWSARFENL